MNDGIWLQLSEWLVLSTTEKLLLTFVTVSVLFYILCNGHCECHQLHLLQGRQEVRVPFARPGNLAFVCWMYPAGHIETREAAASKNGRPSSCCVQPMLSIFHLVYIVSLFFAHSYGNKIVYGPRLSIGGLIPTPLGMNGDTAESPHTFRVPIETLTLAFIPCKCRIQKALCILFQSITSGCF